MKAMVLAAGLGTRLGALTADRPKALVTLAGHALLEITLARLRAFGIDDVIINVHHHAQMIVDYLAAHRNFDMRIEVSREEVLLDTGGGLQKAAPFFLASNQDEPFLVHNVDVLSTIDLARMVQFHTAHSALATLAVEQRASSRQLLFDERGQLRGRSTRDTDEGSATTALPLEPLAFSGIHVVSPRIFARLTEQGTFSIVDAYLRLASQGETIAAFRAVGCYWRDLGRPQSLAEAERDLASGQFSIG